MNAKTSLWWVTTPGQSAPVGPVSVELLRRGIAAGRVPDSALVCAVGTRRWRPFSDIVESEPSAAEFDPESERVHFDLQPLPAEDA